MFEIRCLRADDVTPIADAFADANKTVEQYQRYLSEVEEGLRDVWVAFADAKVAGYVTLVWQPTYPGLVGRGVPEIQDLNVVEGFRRRKIASRLLDHAEAAAAERADEVAIGVGLHPGYNAAQRLYVLRGYVPDALGVTYNDRFVAEREIVRFDDGLVLHFSKQLRRKDQ